MKIVAITGASGFIGKHLVTDLGTRGYAVRALVRELPGQRSVLWNGSGAVRVYRYQGLEDTKVLEEAVRGADVVVHLAARVHVIGETAPDPLHAFRKVNVEGTQSVTSVALHCGVRHLIFLSSVKAVAERSAPSEPLNSSTEPLPTDPYGISKLEAERLLENSASNGALAVTVLRPPLVYGPGGGGNMVRLFRLVDRGVPLPFGGIENRRSFVYVGNLAFALRCLIESRAAGYRRYYASDMADLSTPDLIRLIGEALNRPARLIDVPDGLLGLAGRVGDLVGRVMPFPLSSETLRRLTDSLVIDSTPLWAECRNSPPFTPRKGLSVTGAWFRTTKVGALGP